MSSNAFKRPQDRYGESAPTETPYHRAAQVWDERIGAARVQARSWRLMAFGCLALAGVSTGAFLYVQLRHPIAAYAVPFDRYGRPGRVELIDRAYKPDQAIKAGFVWDFVERVRAKSTDPVVLRQNWTRAKQMTNASARATLVQYGQDHDPAARLGQEAVAVEIASAGPPVRWTGLFTVAPRPPKTESELFDNPQGLEITGFQWSRDL